MKNQTDFASNMPGLQLGFTKLSQQLFGNLKIGDTISNVKILLSTGNNIDLPIKENILLSSFDEILQFFTDKYPDNKNQADLNTYVIIKSAIDFKGNVKELEDYITDELNSMNALEKNNAFYTLFKYAHAQDAHTNDFTFVHLVDTNQLHLPNFLRDCRNFQLEQKIEFAKKIAEEQLHIERLTQNKTGTNVQEQLTYIEKMDQSQVKLEFKSNVDEKDIENFIQKNMPDAYELISPKENKKAVLQDKQEIIQQPVKPNAFNELFKEDLSKKLKQEIEALKIDFSQQANKMHLSHQEELANLENKYNSQLKIVQQETKEKLAIYKEKIMADAFTQTPKIISKDNETQVRFVQPEKTCWKVFTDWVKYDCCCCCFTRPNNDDNQQPLLGNNNYIINEEEI